MCDSSFEEDLERYRRNNVELAVALNDLKTDLNIVQMELLQRNRELQRAHAENATLKLDLMEKDKQLSTWRALIVNLVQTNTRKYSEVMEKIGLVQPAAGSTAIKRPNQFPPPVPKTTEKPMPTSTASKPIEPNGSNNIVQRRPKEKDAGDFSPDLSNLTEESMASQLNESRSLETTPVKSVNHVVSRRRASVPPVTPPSSSPLAPRQMSERMVSNGETHGKKPTAKVKKMDKIIDENTPVNGATGRPSRKTAPKDLSEPKLRTKLRRN